MRHWRRRIVNVKVPLSNKQLGDALTRIEEDALQRRISRFIAEPAKSRALNQYLSYTLGTDVGQVRKENQDRCIIITASYSYAPERNFTLSVVCDGVGGLENGADAATIAISTFASQVIRTTSVPIEERLRNAAQIANQSVYTKYSGRSGTTISALLITDELVAGWVNIGDSRVYGISKDSTLLLLSKDDTLRAHLSNRANFVAEASSKLIQYVGMGDDLEPNIGKLFRDEYKGLLLTTDGIHSAPELVLNTVIDRAQDRKEVVERLLMLSSSLGGRDNSTVICMDAFINNRPSADQGLTLTFLSPFDRLEIWVPRPAHENRLDRLPQALDEATRSFGEQLNDSQKPDDEKSHTKQRRLVSLSSKRKKTKSRRSLGGILNDQDNENKDQPELSIDFTKSGEED